MLNHILILVLVCISSASLVYIAAYVAVDKLHLLPGVEWPAATFPKRRYFVRLVDVQGVGVNLNSKINRIDLSTPEAKETTSAGSIVKLMLVPPQPATSIVIMTAVIGAGSLMPTTPERPVTVTRANACDVMNYHKGIGVS